MEKEQTSGGSTGRAIRMEEWEGVVRGLRERRGNANYASRIGGVSYLTARKIWEAGVWVIGRDGVRVWCGPVKDEVLQAEVGLVGRGVELDVKAAAEQEVEDRGQRAGRELTVAAARIEAGVAKAEGGFEGAPQGVAEVKAGEDLIRATVERRMAERREEERKGLREKEGGAGVKAEEQALAAGLRAQSRAMLTGNASAIGLLAAMVRKGSLDWAGMHGLKFAEVIDQRGQRVGSYVEMSEDEKVGWELRTGVKIRPTVDLEEVYKIGGRVGEVLGRIGAVVELAQKIEKVSEGRLDTNAATGQELSVEEALGVITRATQFGAALAAYEAPGAMRVGEIRIGGKLLDEVNLSADEEAKRVNQPETPGVGPVFGQATRTVEVDGTPVEPDEEEQAALDQKARDEWAAFSEEEFDAGVGQ